MSQSKLLKLLRQLRQEAKLTQTQLAEKLRESQSYVSKYENGEQRLDLIEIERICTAVGTDLRAFVDKYLDDCEPEVQHDAQAPMGRHKAN